MLSIFFVTFALFLAYFNRRFVLVNLVFDITLFVNKLENKLMRDRFCKTKIEKSTRFLLIITTVSILIIKSR